MKHFLFYLSFLFLLACSKKEQPNLKGKLNVLSTGLLINEILPNPKTGGAEFIELYNPTEQTIDLHDLQLARIHDDTLSPPKPITKQSSLFLPRTYKVITKDPSAILSQYASKNPQDFIAMDAFPVLPNTRGSIALLRGDSLVDRLDYDERMHSPFIKDAKGVSLERRYMTEETNAPGNFTSAAASSGYATPGYQNSQYQDIISDDKGIWLANNTFSPDSHNSTDFLQIHYQFKQGSNMITLHIFNDQGIRIRRLYDNYLLGTSGTLDWNGLDDAQQRLPVGIYLIYAEVYNAIDGVKKYRKSCVLSRK
ncbi:hypothetical protein GCM10023231_36520 [Olivibacter ginsenosidimutans]|uniref:LTD domain-containing protein n=1 Tax=Olivibacter ginsenosidimutans TaxID=1176537 RepID=A0ABP9C5I7_9SPHI